MEKDTTKTNIFIKKIKQFRFSFISHICDVNYGTIGQLHCYTFNKVPVGNGDYDYRAQLKKTYDEFTDEVERNLLLLNSRDDRNDYLESLYDKLCDCSEVVAFNYIQFHKYYEKGIRIVGSLYSDGGHRSLSEAEREELKNEENDGPLVHTVTVGDYFTIDTPIHYLWSTPTKKNYEWMVEVHYEFMEKATKYISRKSELQKTTASITAPATQDEVPSLEKTEQEVRRILAPLMGKGKKGMIIISQDNFEQLVSVYVEWFGGGYKTPVHADRFIFHGSNEEFYAPLRQLHKAMNWPMSGKNSIAPALMFILTSNEGKMDALKQSVIEKNIKNGGKYRR